LQFLHKKGVVFGHLHSGNVIMKDERTCLLSDIENSVLDLPPFYMAYIAENSRIVVCVIDASVQ
jgi:PX domain-containing protein kinase-like protein